VTTKRCSKCGRELPVEAFSRHRRSSDGRAWWCRECAAAQNREYRARNPELTQAYNEARRVGIYRLRCVQCGVEFEAGRKDAKLCGRRRCKDKRYQRLHPEAYRAKCRRKGERRRQRKREAAER
jgi:hypothetical protein